MAGKLTIRRKGGCFPPFCLLLLIIFVVPVVWLSTVGLPESALRSIEQEAAKAGVHLQIGSIKLAPAEGLAVKAERLALRATQDAEQPLLTLGKAIVELRLENLLAGEVMPRSIELARGAIHLPVDNKPGEQLNLKLGALTAKLNSSGRLRLTEADLAVEGVSIRLRGTADLSPYLNAETASDKPAAAESGPLDIPALLEQAAAPIRETYRVIRSQDWQPHEQPSLEITFNAGANPETDLNATLHLNLPRYDVGIFHFRRGEAQLEYRNNTVVIHTLRFRTVDPDSGATIQGGYELGSRTLSFNVNSDAPVIRMAEQLLEDKATLDLLGKIQHPEADTPNIDVAGHIRFSEDYYPEDIHVRGDLTQQNLYIGKSLVNRFETSFLYENGNFNIQKFDLALPEGSLKLTASLRDGKGVAGINADIDVAKLLMLVSEFTPEPVILPEGLALQGHTRVQFEAELSAPPFVPGQSHWQDFVPHVENIALHVNVDEADYGKLQLTLPSVAVVIAAMEQGEDMLPTAIHEAALEIRLDRARWNEGDAAKDISLEQLRFAVDLDDIGLRDLLGEKPDVEVGRGDILLRARQPKQGELSAEGVKLTLKADKGFRYPADWEDILTSAVLELTAEGLCYAEQDPAQAKLQLTLDEAQPASADLSFNLTNAEGRTFFLKARPDWGDPDHPAVQNLELELPMASFSPVLEHFGITTDAVKLPEMIRLKGQAEFDVPDKRLAEGRFHLSIPEIVRTPGHVKALAGREVTLAVEADVALNTPPKGKLGFVADLDVHQDTGEFKGRVQGDADGRIRITGNNTIRADVVDALIDLNDAHEIIRDFQFTDTSKNIVTDIDVNVDLTDAGGGVRVDSFCKAELVNVAYMMGGIEVLPDGTERVRTDFGPNPFTLCSHGTCSVLVHVVLDCTDARGNKVPDECTITLGNAVLDYDNAPWFKRQGFKSGTRNTQLTGDSVIIDVEHSFVEINNIRGTVYPAYSIGMFYAPLQDFLSDVLIYSPALVETEQCVFPIYYDCTRPMSGTIRATCAEECGFRFIGTTIPLSNFSGFIYLTDNYVQLDKMNATCWQGVLDAVVNIGFSGKHTTFDGYAKAQAMNLREIAGAYGNEQKDALCDASIRFRAGSPELNDIQAYGYVNIVDGDLLSLSLFHPVRDLLSDIPGYFSKLEQSATEAIGAKKGTSLFGWFFKSTGAAVDTVGDQLDTWSNNIPFANYILTYNLKDAYAEFTIGNGHLQTHRMKAMGSNLKIDANLDINLDTLVINGNMWPRISSLPTIILSPITFLSKYLIDITVSGPIEDLSWGFGLSPRLKGSEPSATAD